MKLTSDLAALILHYKNSMSEVPRTEIAKLLSITEYLNMFKKFTYRLWKQETFSEEDHHKPYMTAGISILSLLVHELCLLTAEELGNRKRKFAFHFKYVMPSTCFDNPVRASFQFSQL